MTRKTPKKNERSGVDRLGRTPLHYAAVEGKLAVAKRLLAKGANPSLPDDNGWTPLHFAAQRDHAGLVEILLDAGAEVEARDSNGNTPLFHAVFAYQNNGDVITLLCTRGANAKRKNSHGVSPLGMSKDLEDRDMTKRLLALLQPRAQR